MLNDMLSQIRKGAIFISAIYILIGLFLLIFPSQSITVICAIIGIMIMAFGVFYIVQYFKIKREFYGLKMDLLVGIIAVLAGLFVAFNSKIVFAIIPIIMGIFLLADALIKVKDAYYYKELGYDKWWLGLIGSALVAILGIVILFNPFATANAIMILIGASLLFDGIYGIVAFTSFR